MQTQVIENKIFGGYLVTVLAVCVLTSLCAPNLNYMLLHVLMWTYLLPLLVLLTRNNHLKDTTTALAQKPSLFSWLVIIFFSQIVLFLLHFSILYGLSLANPSIVASVISHLRDQVSSFLLFPGLLLALLVIHFQKLKREGRPLTVICLNTTPKQTLRIRDLVFDFSGRVSASLSLILCLFALISIIINDLAQPWLPNIHGKLNITSFLMSVSIVGLLHMPPCRHLLQRALQRRVNFATLLLFFSLALLLTLICLDILLDGLNSPDTLMIWNQEHQDLYLALVSSCWWLGCARLYAGFITQYSKHQHPLFILIVMLCLPALASTSNYLTPHLLETGLLWLYSQATLISVCTLMGLFLFLRLYQRSAWLLLASELDSGHARKQPRKQALRWFFGFATLATACLLTGLRVFAILTGLSLFYGAFLLLAMLKHSYPELTQKLPNFLK